MLFMLLFVIEFTLGLLALALVSQTSFSTSYLFEQLLSPAQSILETFLEHISKLLNVSIFKSAVGEVGITSFLLECKKLNFFIWG